MLGVLVDRASSAFFVVFFDCCRFSGLFLFDTCVIRMIFVIAPFYFSLIFF